MNASTPCRWNREPLRLFAMPSNDKDTFRSPVDCNLSDGTASAPNTSKYPPARLFCYLIPKKNRGRLLVSEIANENYERDRQIIALCREASGSSGEPPLSLDPRAL